MTMTVLSTLTLMKSIMGLSGFYSLGSRCGTLFNTPTSNKHWKDHWLFIGDQWLAGGGSFVGHVTSCFQGEL